MLPSWRKELRIVLCPGKVVVVAFTNVLRRKLVSQAILPFDAENPADWRPAITSVERWLAENDVDGDDATIYLSNCFVRFAMLPFTEGMNNYAERLAVAGLLFESIYGETARQWKLTLDEEQYGEPCLVAAIDIALAETIDQLVSSCRFRAATVQPYAVSALNAFSKQISDGEGLVAAVDHGQAVLVDIREKKVMGIRKVMLGIAADGQQIIDTLRREMLISGLSTETAKIYLHIGGRQEGIPAIPGVDMIALQHANKDDRLAGDYAMACVEDEP